MTATTRKSRFFNFNFILPKVNTDYLRHAQVMNIDNLRLKNVFMKILRKHNINLTNLKHHFKKHKT